MFDHIDSQSWHLTVARDGSEKIGKPGPWDAALVHFTRIIPGDESVTVDWEWRPGSRLTDMKQVHIRIQQKGGSGHGSKDPTVQRQHEQGGSATFRSLTNGRDYEIQVSINGKEGGKEAAIRREVRPGRVPGTVINYIHPDDPIYDFSGRSPASPSIARLPDGRLVASHDVYWWEAGQNLTQLFRSEDNGDTWTFVTNLYPCFWGKLFVHQNHLYMLATSTEYGALLIGRSEDGGNTWTPPTILIGPGSREQGGPHKAPMPVITHRGRLWTSVDYGSWTTGGHCTGVISIAVDADLLDCNNWTLSPFLPYNKDWQGTTGSKIQNALLEGNVVVTPDGQLAVIPRYQTQYGKGIILHVNQDNPAASLSFGKVIDFHGNLSKFTIQYDVRSNRYWSLVNRGTRRNILTLVYSVDLETWHIAKDILDYENNGWPEDHSKVGFQYVDWLVDGDDLLFVSRTAINGANSFHDANHLTFHRIKQFREL